MSSKNFEAGLSRQYDTAEDKHAIDVTVYLQMMFESTDRHIAKAIVNDGRSMVLQIGMRSEILSPFPRYREDFKGTFNQCDIIGLVPIVALMVEQKGKMIAASAIERDESTRIILVFESDTPQLLARKIWRFMDRWERWIKVLTGVLEKDLNIDLDWREFLAGESGFITMDWYKPLDYDTRAVALHRVRLASKALLQSVLNGVQLDNYMVSELYAWLNSLQPQLEVMSAYQFLVPEEIT